LLYQLLLSLAYDGIIIDFSQTGIVYPKRSQGVEL